MSVVQDLFSCDSFVRGHHVYKDDWTPTLGEILECKREPQNEKDPNAVAVTKDGKVVSHVPLIYTRYVSRFLELESSSASCEVTGKRLNRGGGYGLEVPCKYKFQGVPKVVAWIAKCIGKENDKITTAVDLNQDTKKRRKNTSDSTDSSKRQRK